MLQEVPCCFAKRSLYNRLEELEKEKRAMVKSIDAEATAKKKEAEEGEPFRWILSCVIS